jgi:CheY-like chemotaxis protein
MMSLAKRQGLIIVVDDDDSIRRMLCELLKASGFKAIGCKDGQEALLAIRQRMPAAVTLDLHMPGMDGVELLDHLAEDELTSRIPVVVVSAYSSDRRLRSREQVKAIIQKPFDVDDLCEKVARAANGTGRAA